MKALKDNLGQAGYIIYIVIFWITFVYLTFFDGYSYNAWNWLIAIPANIFLSQIWPIYWVILQWI